MPMEYSVDALPMLINYQEGMGGSLFSISLAVGYVQSGLNVIFYSAYPMATNEILDQTQGKIPILASAEDHKIGSAILPNGNEKMLMEAVGNFSKSHAFFVKNFELLSQDSIKVLEKVQKIILSGDCDQTSLNIDFNTVITFSNKPHFSFETPELDRFEAYHYRDGQGSTIKLVV